MAQKERLARLCLAFASRKTDYVRLRRGSSSLSTYFLNIKVKRTSRRISFLLGAEGETRTLAPVSRPTPLAGAPRHQLEYFCIGNKLMLFYCTNAASGTCSTCYGAESGIRTHGTLPYDGFQDRSVITTSVSLHIA